MSRRSADRVFVPGETLLGKYKVVRVVGEGGMGAVLEAENVRTSRRVAVKVLTGVDDAKATTATKRFVNEARAAAKLTHPNSVDVLDLESDDSGALYIVQEFLVGETLHDRLLRERRLPWREALELMLPVMSALAEAHRKGIVHRDVKPENIFLTEAAPGVVVPKIIDFGIARLAETDLRLTRNDRVMGTPYYMSPEQAAGQRDLDGQTDVWAVGVVLYEAITGALPFDGNNLEVVMRAIVRESFTPMRLRDPLLPEALVAAVERSLVRERDRRYASMQDFLDALLACAGEAPVGVGRIRGSSPPKEPAPHVDDDGPASLEPAITDSAERQRRTAGLRVTPSTMLALASTLMLGLASGALLTVWLRPPRVVAVTQRAPAVPLQCPPAAPEPAGVAEPVAVPAAPLPVPVVDAGGATTESAVVAPGARPGRFRGRVRTVRRPRR
ncbi:MAG: protein kinase [Polyangiales bacterium]